MTATSNAERGPKAASIKVSIEDIKLAYTPLGEGPPLLALHGGPGLGHAYLRPGFDALADHLQLIYLDQRGSGASELGDPDRVTVAGALQDLEGLRKALEIDSWSLIGHSTGSLIGMLYASRYPDRVRSLVLYSIAPPLVPEFRERFSASMGERRGDRDQAEMEEIKASEEFKNRDPATIEAYYRVRYRAFFRDPGNSGRVDYGFTKTTAENVLESGLSDLGDHDPVGSMARVACPTLVAHGEHDPIPLDWGRFVADQVPDAQFVRIDGASHFAHIEDPEKFVEAVRPFLAEHAS